MKERDFDTRRLDVQAFGKAAGELSGEWALTEFKRLQPLLSAEGERTPVRWTVQGREGVRRGASSHASHAWLHLTAAARLPLSCQRCLQPLALDLDLARDFQFVADEDEAARLDGEVEHEVLVLSRDLDLRDLLEDELLLDLPLVPRHEVCPLPLPLPLPAEAANGADEAAPHPFAALAALKKPAG